METIVENKWHWYNVRNDLAQQGKLNTEDIIIHPFTTNPHGCGGKFLGELFYITWVKDAFLLLSMKEYSQKLVNAFATVIEYIPFVRYDKDGYTTVEWDKIDPQGRLDALQEEKGLVSLLET